MPYFATELLTGRVETDSDGTVHFTHEGKGMGGEDEDVRECVWVEREYK